MPKAIEFPNFAWERKGFLFFPLTIRTDLQMIDNDNREDL